MAENSFWKLLGGYAALMVVGLLVLYFIGTPIIELINVALGMSTVYVSILMVYTSIQSVQATKYVGELGIKPLVIAYIRPARHYSDQQRIVNSWLPGVGIFIENIGNGPAINGTIKCILSSEKEERTYEMNFGRLKPGQVYTYPSISEPKLEIKTTDNKIVINIEYEDAIRKHRIEEPTIIEIKEEFFTIINTQP